ncbi:uncharacterized protein BXZ73DRAFT_98951 [Epithele typhae]|uniref:uncharacterized protein n=1 Tax=Epithele typhae TaxID=378194 RepID=UPI0020074BC7|nr:uncharacterized protein BXZ73DRAFT_98951 [Epithele typhae]KAH9940521.1 hypothetical protein BXZ73DRAFT_98951 [Epithele typhae]
MDSSAIRKPKVDLRPAPVKPTKKELASSAPAVPKAATSSEASESLKATNEKVPLSSTLGIDDAKKDMVDAAQHGILTPPPEGASWPKRLLHQAKELFKFYWNGVKLVNSNRLRVKAIQARIKGGGAPLSRWETRFIATNRQDILKLIPFLLIVAIAEEVIPLVVLYAPFLLPSTCLLPSQRERISNKRREKQKTFLETMKPMFQGVHNQALANSALSVDVLLDSTATLSYSGVLSLSTWGPPPSRLRRVKKYLDSIAADDTLLIRENWGEMLIPIEVQEALEERGIVTQDLSAEAMRARLRWWLAGVSQAGIDPVRRRVELVAANAIGKYNA